MYAPVAMMRKAFLKSTAVVALAVAASCGPSTNVDNAESARRAYLGIDLAMDKALNLGMQGFNMASSANIPNQTGTGGVSGTLVVGGQVDQGASANKQMRLTTDFTNYEDAIASPDDAGALHIVYSATSSATTLNLSLRGIPMGTFTGTFVQTLHMTGNLTGDVTLNLAFTGEFRPTAAGAMTIERTPNTTHITGTAVSTYGTYAVDVTR